MRGIDSSWPWFVPEVVFDDDDASAALLAAARSLSAASADETQDLHRREAPDLRAVLFKRRLLLLLH